jgi:pantoate--beta-alanine ligase
VTAPLILETPAELGAWSDARHARHERLALVPTMGYLHEGHLSLVREARNQADRVIVSIFVNPAQFGPKEDLSRYPADLAGDLAKLEKVGVDVVFAPKPPTMYPAGFDTWVVPGELARGLCGATRPGHFRGVATVVLMLFTQSRADVALFGEKDFQQLAIIKRMARDLWLPIKIVGCPIVREPDGLALSSRNVYLSPEERQQALVLHRALALAERLLERGERRAGKIVEQMRELIATTPAARIDYVELVDADTLAPVTDVRGEVVAAVAVFFGKTRLIDNRRLSST